MVKWCPSVIHYAYDRYGPEGRRADENRKTVTCWLFGAIDKFDLVCVCSSMQTVPNTKVTQVQRNRLAGQNFAPATRTAIAELLAFEYEELFFSLYTRNSNVVVATAETERKVEAPA